MLFEALPGGTAVVSSPGAAVVSPVATLNKKKQNNHFSGGSDFYDEPLGLENI